MRPRHGPKGGRAFRVRVTEGGNRLDHVTQTPGKQDSHSTNDFMVKASFKRISGRDRGDFKTTIAGRHKVLKLETGEAIPASSGKNRMFCYSLRKCAFVVVKILQEYSLAPVLTFASKYKFCISRLFLYLAKSYGLISCLKANSMWVF